MDKFLKQVASYYAAKKAEGLDLGSYTFVFPNKRAAMFMRKYLKETYGQSCFMPRMITITAFTQEFSSLPIGGNIELLFLLYQAYAQVMKEKGRADQAKDFDAFVFWGQVLLNDFNDVDSCLVDESQLFKNVKAEREIMSNYLTPEQIEVARILGEKYIQEVKPEHFWRHVGHNDDAESAQKKFINLWEVLHELYCRFNRLLAQRGITYSGMQSRMVQHDIADMGVEDFHGHRYAFIGFYVLPPARMLIFKKLRELGIAEFFWDTASPLLSLPGNKAADLIKALAKEFPAPRDFQLEEIAIDDLPDFRIIAVPSNIGQAKVAARVLRQWSENDREAGTDAINHEITGLVLPNEKLLTPVLYSLPGDVNKLNVAMRVNFTNTPFASLITAILYMQENCRTMAGAHSYFYKDVLEILSQPYVSSMAPTEAQALRDKITKEHLYNVPSAEICQMCPTLAPIFREAGRDIILVKAYLDGLIEALSKFVTESIGKMSHNIDEEITTPYEALILEAYGLAIRDIYELADQYGIAMKERTFFSLLRRLLIYTHIQLNGDPVTGLQILGLQDARGLDFDNLIVLSLNERIQPKKNFSPSLIPPTLRAAYGMPTVETEEITMAYQFYRLITRATRLCLIYDSRTPDEASGEISRYLQQLKIMLKDKAKVESPYVGMKPFSPRTITIEKDERVMEELKSFLPGGNRNISASALKSYIQCPLRFYLQSVKGMRYDNFDPEYMDAASYGSILHKVAERFYIGLRGEGKNVLIRPEHLRQILDNPRLIGQLTKMALDAMNEIYYGGKYADVRLIPGEGRVLARVIATYIRHMLQCESGGKEFVFVSGEDEGGKHTHQWCVDGERTVNFTMSIDRIDQLDDAGQYLRFIDYKTGSDELRAPSIESLFVNHDFGAIFQLMLYCLAYGDLMQGQRGVDYAIQPKVYLFSKIKTEGLPDLLIGKEPLLDYRKYRDEFRERLSGLLEDIFGPEKPFTQTEDADQCKYCPFATMCGRIDTKD